MSIGKLFNKLMKLGDENSISKALMLLKEEALIKSEEDEADNWLKQHEEQTKAKRSSMRDWEVPEVAEHHSAKISDLVNRGFSEREAHRLVGTHSEHGDAISALKSSIRPSKPSQAFLDHIRDHAKERLGKLSQLKRREASAEKNPQLYAEGRMGEAHADYEKSLSSAINEFKNSDEFKSAHPMKKPLMISKFKANWANSEEGQKHVKGFEQGYEAHKEAGQSRQDYLQSIASHMTSAGFDPDAQSMSSAIQHAGGSSGDKESGDGMSGVTISKDPLTAFIEKNPHLVDHLKTKMPDMSERMNRLESSKKFADKPDKPEKPKMVIRRRGE